MALLYAIAGEGYSSNASINAHPNFSASATTLAVAQNLLPAATAPVGEKWFELPIGSGSAAIQAVLPGFDLGTLPDGTNIEYEMSFAMVLADGTHDANDEWAQFVYFVNQSNTGWKLNRDTIAGRMQLGESNSGVGNNNRGDNVAAIEFDKVVYVTLRVRGETATAGGTDGLNDARVEVYANGIKTHSISGINASSGTVALLQHSGGNFFRLGSNEKEYVKNITIYDQWTTANDVAPSIKRVTDDGGFATTVEDVDISYYIGNVDPNQLQAALGPNNRTDVNTNLPFNWVGNASYEIDNGIPALALLRDVGNEDWMTPRAVWQAGVYHKSYPQKNDDGAVEWENHGAYYLDPTLPLDNNQDFINWLLGGVAILKMYVTSSREFRFDFNEVTRTPNRVVSHLENDGLFYIQIKLRGNSLISNDSTVEIWINGELIWNVTENIGVVDGAAGTNTLFMQYGTNEIGLFSRNLTCWNGWQSADGQASKYYRVDGPDETVVEVPSWYYFGEPPEQIFPNPIIFV